MNPMIHVTKEVNTLQYEFTFVMSWIIGFTLFLVCIEGDNNRKDTNDSFQLLSSSIESRRRVNPTIQVTPTVNPYSEVLTFRVTWIIKFTLLLLSIEDYNN